MSPMGPVVERSKKSPAKKPARTLFLPPTVRAMQAEKTSARLARPLPRPMLGTSASWSVPHTTASTRMLRWSLFLLDTCIARPLFRRSRGRGSRAIGRRGGRAGTRGGSRRRGGRSRRGVLRIRGGYVIGGRLLSLGEGGDDENLLIATVGREGLDDDVEIERARVVLHARDLAKGQPLGKDPAQTARDHDVAHLDRLGGADERECELARGRTRKHALGPTRLNHRRDARGLIRDETHR